MTVVGWGSQWVEELAVVVETDGVHRSAAAAAALAFAEVRAHSPVEVVVLPFRGGGESLQSHGGLVRAGGEILQMHVKTRGHLGASPEPRFGPRDD